MSLDAVLDALRALYAGSNARDVDALNRTLLDAQASKEAWTWLDSLLSSEVCRLCPAHARRILTLSGSAGPVLRRVYAADQDQP